jgi:hypothetical protein
MRMLACVLVFVGLMLASGPSLAQEVSSREIVALHWLPQTALEARARSLAYAAGSLKSHRESITRGETGYVSLLESIRAQVTPQASSSQWIDGSWGHWVLWSQRPDLTDSLRLDSSTIPTDPEQQWHVWQAIIARWAPKLWGEASTQERGQYFGDLADQLWQASPEERSHALTQAQRLERMASARSEATAHTILASVLLSEAQFQWDRRNALESVWLLLEGLMRVTHQDDQQNARYYETWLASLSDTQIRESRVIDQDLPLIIALMLDAASDLQGDAQSKARAIVRLTSAYTRLALFMPTMSAYLEQPIRDELNNTQSLCLKANDASSVRACLNALRQTFFEDLDGEELVGSMGPFSTEFLLRELGLSTWQRAQYVDGYLQWRLGGSCTVASWFNLLEWNLGAQWWWRLESSKDSFAPRVGITTENELNSWLNKSNALSAQVRQWMDCMANQQGERSDLVTQLITLATSSLDDLEAAIAEQERTFYRESTRPGADVSLDAAVVEETQYRNATLMIGPCQSSNVCGARISLPSSEALLNLVPNGYWMAEQLQLGQVNMCYDNVRWIDRALTEARKNDAGVANYSGRLSLEVRAEFQKESAATETIFVHRYDSEERANYFFAEANEARLTLDCTHGLEGVPIESQLKTKGSGLVPDRLTYFTSTPVSVGMQLSMHWDEWQGHLIDGQNTQIVVPADDETILGVVQAQRLALRDRRERSLSTGLTQSNSRLADAMLEVHALSGLIQGTLELHYGPLIRHDPIIRSLMVGSRGLLSRDDIRVARDNGILMRDVVTMGRSRLDQFEAHWLGYPSHIRETGMMVPELIYADLILSDLSDGLPKEP